MRTDRDSVGFDLPMNTNKVRGTGALYTSIFAILVALLAGGGTLAASDTQLQQSFDEATRQVNRSRGLTLAILKQIKQLDAACRSGDGSPILSRTADARNLMARIKPLVDGFHANADEAESMLNDLNSELSQQAGSSDLVADLRNELATMTSDLEKYRGHVGKYWNRSIDDFGPPTEPLKPTASVPGDPAAQIHGELSLGLGGSKHTRPNAGPGIDASSTDLSLSLMGRYTPGAATGIDAHLSHKKTTMRREIGQTNLGATLTHHLSSQVSLSGGFDLFKYDDKKFDVFDYSQTGLFAQVAAQTSGHKSSIVFRRDSRGYSKNSAADYNTLSFTAVDLMSIGVGQLKMQLHYLKKSNDIKISDHTEMNPRVVYTFSPGGSQIGVSYQQFKMPNANDSPMENNRLKLHLYSERRSATGSRRWGPEVQMYKYPNLDDADKTDFKLKYNSTSRGKKMLLTQLSLVYRMHQDTLRFDFAQAKYRRNSRPVGSGFYQRLSLAARYYIEASDKDDSLRFSNVHPAHTVDVYYHFGWSRSSKGFLRTLSIGPILGAKAFIDTERADAFDEDIVDVDFLLRNPRNTARIGLDIAAGLAIDPGVTGQAELRFVQSASYNADPIRSNGTLELKLRFTYPVNREWFVDGYGNLHSTRADIASPSDLDKSQVGVQVRYLFDVRP
ncbi:MAG: hypothetical protein OEV49_07455 [candidate division Zixibacteria bacterium]|nr:hypothetical protein [candidate division Zixibacteria bacterium]MDH3936097.1 hypothetical protein [candidate division Zixibacteria bacterium]MDH4032474.1 hypothetical protein [candidate division Zixibacteria bacterium]